MNIQDQRSGDLGNGYYINPILSGDYPDPTICRDGADYYMTHSAGRYAPGLLLWHSKDLVNWEPVKQLLTESDMDIWAPDIVKHEDMFYVYFCANGHNWVIKAKDPYGEWSKPFMMNADKHGGEPIDPGHIVDVQTGERWIFVSGGYAARISQDGMDFIEDYMDSYGQPPIPLSWNTEGNCTESPKLFYRNGYYYLSIAQGGTAGPSTAHMVTSMRSKSLKGPWEYSPYNPIIHTAKREENWWCKGHATIIDDIEGNWWIYYHTYEKNYMTLGRQNNLEPLEWTDDGWFRVADGYYPERAWPKPAGVAVDGRLMMSDDLCGNSLPAAFRFFAEEKVAERYTMTGNGIAIKAKGDCIAKSSPLTVQPHHHSYRVQVKAAVSKGARGGLLLFYNEKAFCGVTADEGYIYAHIREDWYFKAEKHNLKEIYFRIDNTQNDVGLFWSEDGEVWNKLIYSPEVSGMQHNIFGGYLALKPAMAAQGQGEVVFRDFRYYGLI